MRPTHFLTALLAAFLAIAPARAEEKLTLTDLAGRQVTVTVPVKTLILGEGRYVPILAMLDPDPISRIAGMPGDFRQLDPAGHAAYLKRFPQMKDIPVIGHGSAQSFSLEKSITVKPDVAVFGLGSGHGPGARHKEMLDALTAAGVPVVILDFRMEPIANTPKSMELLGRLLGREKEARAFIDFYSRELARVTDGLKGVSSKPRTFLEIHVGMREDCCASMGNAMMGRFIELAGGDNLAAGKIPGSHGLVSLEHLLARPPEVYIATAIGAAGTTYGKPGRIVLGPGADAATAQEGLKRAMARSGISGLKAVKDGRAFALWHHFYNTPLHVAAIQAIAKWLHPDIFRDLDPQATLAEMFRRFQPVPLDGVYWMALDAGVGR